MKRFVIVAGTLIALALFGVAVAQGPGWGPGIGPGMMWGSGPSGQYGYPCMGPGMMGGQGWGGPQIQVTEEGAKAAAQQYTDKYLKGYTVERVLPFTGMGGMTMYQVELQGPNGESRILHVNPWGNVMPFGGAQTRGR